MSETNDETVEGQQTEPRKPYVYVPRTDDELKQLAMDIVAGKVFGSWSHPEALRISFGLVLNFIDRATLQEMIDQDVALFYEYIDKASPRGVNGLPTFFSLRALSRSDAEKVEGLINKLNAMNAEFMKS